MSAEKVAAWVGIIVFVAGVVVAWANLNNRLDKMDEKIAGIEDALGSAACNAILPRQIDAIEKNRKDALKALQALSRQYDCGPHKKAQPSPFDARWPDAVQNASTVGLSAELNAVDVLLSESNASDAPQTNGATNSN